jgi:Ca2+-binding EF-hand superfamily protein
MKFSDLYSDDNKLNSIFNSMDNGNEIVDKTEINIIKFLFKKYDKNNNGAIESNELENINQENIKEDCDAVKIAENAKEFISTLNKLKPTAAKGVYIKSIYLSSTMSQGVKVDPKSAE